MANTPSAKKAVRKIARRTAVNKSRRTRLRSNLRALEEAIAGGDKSVAEAKFKEVQPVVMKSATKGIIHKNTASRKVSRLASRIKAMGA